MGPLDHDSYFVDQLIRPIANLSRVTPLAAVVAGMNRKFQLRDRYVLDLSGDPERRLDRRLAIAPAVGLGTLQNR